MQRVPLLPFLFSLLLLAQTSCASSRPVIMVTGYWPPTNEMVREFSQEHSASGWQGKNWEGRGYDIQSFFPEFAKGDKKGSGDFEVDFADTKADFERITAELKPIAILSFGLGAGPWEIETTFPDHWQGGPTLHSSLPVEAIKENLTNTNPQAWIDRKSDAGNYLCGYLGWLGARYHEEHQDPRDPARIYSQSFIHVSEGYSMELYRESLYRTLRALIAHLDEQK